MKKWNLKYTQKCMYIDEEMKKETYDADRVFEYLSDIIGMLAVKRCFFETSKDYKDFTLYATTRVFLRLINPKQKLPESDPKHIPQIKSILNFVKKTLYPMKVDFQNMEYKEIQTEDTLDPKIIQNIKQELEFEARNCDRSLLEIDVKCYLGSIDKVIHNFLKTTPYSKDRVMMERLHISCLLSILNSVTLCNANQMRVDNGTMDESLLAECYTEELQHGVIAWHLPKEMRDYVYVLVTQIRKIICEDIRYTMQYYQPSEEILKDILFNPTDEVIADD